MPLYFFRIPISNGFDPSAFPRLYATGDEGVRAVYLVDSANRDLYVLYFPAQEKAHDCLVLQFGK